MPSLHWNEGSHKGKLTRTHKRDTHTAVFLLIQTCRHNPTQNATREHKQYRLISSNSSPARWRDTQAGMACVYSCDRSNLSSQLNIQYSATLPFWTEFHDAFDGSTSKLKITTFNSIIIIHFLCLGSASYRCRDGKKKNLSSHCIFMHTLQHLTATQEAELFGFWSTDLHLP